MAEAEIYAWDETNQEWIKVVVDSDGKVKVNSGS